MQSKDGVCLSTDNRAGVVGRVAAIGCALLPVPSEAHVKWFCSYDVAEQPRVLEHVLNRDFMALLVLAGSILLAGALLDRTELGEAISRALDRVTLLIRVRGNVLVRAMAGFFLVSLWNMGGVYLTPELKTDSFWVPQLQLAMAASLVSRRTSGFAGLGIILLFAVAMTRYGLFHLMDYPIFLGLAVYLIVTSLPNPARLRVDPVLLLRWPAAITLMWASVEKWAYPEWTLPLYIGHPNMSMGYDFELFMRAAGIIEFTLAFALLWTPLVRRSAAFILVGMFISAIGEFGKIDAVGHSMIIAVLLVVAGDDSRSRTELPLWRSLADPALSYAAALGFFVSLYYGVHALLFGTTIT